jgi:hypothetical protein
MNDFLIFIIAIVIIIVGIILINIEIDTEDKRIKKITKSAGWVLTVCGAFGLLPQISYWVQNDNGGSETTTTTSIVSTTTTTTNTTVPTTTTQSNTTTTPTTVSTTTTQATTTTTNNSTVPTTTTQTTTALYSGYGIIDYSNAVYEGYLLNDEPSGEGTMRWENGNIYTGNWVNGIFAGYGVFTFASGDKYEGNFSNDKFHGKGTFIWKDGSSYTGDWANGVRTGYGVYRFSNGDKYEGDFINGELNGQGTITFADGQTNTGIWRDGKLVESITSETGEGTTIMTTDMSSVVINEGDTITITLTVTGDKTGMTLSSADSNIANASWNGGKWDGNKITFQITGVSPGTSSVTVYRKNYRTEYFVTIDVTVYDS